MIVERIRLPADPKDQSSGFDADAIGTVDRGGLAPSAGTSETAAEAVSTVDRGVARVSPKLSDEGGGSMDTMPGEAGGAHAAIGVPRRVGRYSIAGRIATGGMADILLGKLSGPSGFERAVVVKLILPHLARDQGFVNMFLDEAKLTAQLRHPNVVQVQELGQEGVQLFLAMEYLEGEPVSVILRDIAKRGAVMPQALAVYIAAEVAAGLQAAHTLKDRDGTSRAVVHRDVSPQNVFVTYDGYVKLLDFGIAKSTGRLSEQTQGGQLKGKFAYMAPEQAARGEMDARSDVFALGVVLWEMLTGRRLFKRASELMVLRAITEEPYPKIGSVVPRFPALLDSIVMRALARSPAERYQTAHDLRQALLSWLRDTGGEDIVEQQLGAYMGDHFHDRVVAKREMLERVATAEGDEAVEISIVEESSLSFDSSGEMPAMSPELMAELPLPAPPARSRRPRWLLGAVLAVPLLGFAAHRATNSPRDPVPLPSAIASPAIAPPTLPLVPSVPAEVRVHVETIPPGAAVSVDGTTRGRTPIELSVARGVAFNLGLDLPGYTPLVEQRMARNDLDVRVTLQKLPGAVRPRPRKGAGDSDPFHRFQ